MNQTKLPLPDIQRTPDSRGVAIKRVGVTGIRLPVRVRMEDSDKYQDTIGVFEVGVGLTANVKGTHMSRFTEVLNEHVAAGGVFSITDLKTVAHEILIRMEARSVDIRLVVDYFMPQASPVAGRPGVAPLQGMLRVSMDPELGIRTWTGIIIEGKTCCPCSREISEYDRETGKGKGAHAQRGKVTMMLRHFSTELIWFEQLVRIAWGAFSSPVYPVLKRPDERHVTMGAYDNPKFVEDVIRDVTVGVRALPRILEVEIRVQNAESIHYHDAFAVVEE